MAEQPSSHDPAETCTCTKPLTVQRATHKGAARTICARCGKPVRLRLVS